LSLRNKILLAAVVPLVIAAFIILPFFANSTILRAEYKAKVYVDELAYGISIGIKLQIDRYISEISMVAKSLGAMSSNGGLDHKVVNQILPSIIKQNKDLLNAWVVLEAYDDKEDYAIYWYRNADGIINQSKLYLEASPTIRALINESKQSLMANMDAEFGKDSQNMLLIAYPIIDSKNNYIGSVGVNVNLAKFKGLLEDAKNYGVSNANLIESEGLIVESSDKTVERSAKLDSDSFLRIQKLLTTEEEYSTMGLSKVLMQKVYELYLPIKFENLKNSWVLYIVYPLASVHKDVYNRLLFMGFIMAVCLVIGVSGSAVVANNISKSIRRVSEALEEISRGNLNVEIPEITSNDEVGRITAATSMYRRHFTDLMKAKKDAEEAYAAKTEFLANISHELRTPMHAILSYARLGLEKLVKNTTGDVEGKLAKYFNNIYNSGERLLKLLNDLLDLSRLEIGKVQFNFASIDINECINRAVTELNPLLVDKRLNLIVKPLEPNEAINLDAEKFLQVIINLISNAIKFSQEGGDILVSVVRHDMKDIVVSVENSGIGIPDEEVEKIFDAFVQSSKTNKGAGGTGLGLSIAKGIVEAHNGKIWAENKKGKGAVFKILLPIQHSVIQLEEEEYGAE
jgi:signal transduction histidine kinase